MTLDISMRERTQAAPPVQYEDRVSYAFGTSFLGQVLVATSDKGICAIFLGSDREKLITELKRNFPAARPSERQIGEIDKVVSLIADPTKPHDLELDLRGSDLEIKVWLALRTIPPGKTLSYSELAKQIGVTGGEKGPAKEVADACASNRIAVAVPCHRILRKDGTISGYRWGVHRKRALLEREGAL